MKLTKPSISVKDIFDTCINTMHEDNKIKFSPCLSEMQIATHNYEQKMEQGDFKNVCQCTSIQNVSKKDLETLYTNKLSKKGHLARKYYDQIINSAPGGICPYCHQQIVSTLDHYYPKAHYISLVISPSNLIPSCQACNKNKLDAIIRHNRDAFINPYYEDSDQFIWLHAHLNENRDSEQLTMSFYVSIPDNIDSLLEERLENQFQVLKLDHLYSMHAAQDLIAVVRQHKRIYATLGISEVKISVSEAINDNSFRPNSWQSAMYRALDNDWYYSVWLPHKYLTD